jgi:hypothetical protein
MRNMARFRDKPARRIPTINIELLIAIAFLRPSRSGREAFKKKPETPPTVYIPNRIPVDAWASSKPKKSRKGCIALMLLMAAVVN